VDILGTSELVCHHYYTSIVLSYCDDDENIAIRLSLDRAGEEGHATASILALMVQAVVPKFMVADAQVVRNKHLWAT
jgi:hypothetical protein